MLILRKFKFKIKNIILIIKIKTDYNIAMKKKINKQIKYTRKKLNKKNLRKKNSKKKNIKMPKGVMKGGYEPKFVPQVVFSTNVEDPHFDNPFYQYQYYNDTCPYYPTIHEAKSCYSKHNGKPDNHGAADKCIQDLQDTKYKEIPGKCNHNTCCDAKCWGVCEAYHTVFINGVYIPVIWAWHEGKWIAKKIKEYSQDAVLAEEKGDVMVATKVLDELTPELKDAGKDVGEVVGEIDEAKNKAEGNDNADAKDDDKKGDDKGDDKGEDKGEAKEGEKAEAKEGEKAEEKKGGTRKRRFFNFSKKVNFSRKYRKHRKRK